MLKSAGYLKPTANVNVMLMHTGIAFLDRNLDRELKESQHRKTQTAHHNWHLSMFAGRAAAEEEEEEDVTYRHPYFQRKLGHHTESICGPIKKRQSSDKLTLTASRALSAVSQCK